MNWMSINLFVSCLVNWFGPQQFKDEHVVISIIWLTDTKAPFKKKTKLNQSHIQEIN